MEFSTRAVLPGCSVPLGAATARYLSALDVDEAEAARLVITAEPARRKLIELDPTITGKRGTETIVEAVALAAGLAPHEVPAAVRRFLPDRRRPIRDVLYLTRAREALAAEA